VARERVDAGLSVGFEGLEGHFGNCKSETTPHHPVALVRNVESGIQLVERSVRTGTRKHSEPAQIAELPDRILQVISSFSTRSELVGHQAEESLQVCHSLYVEFVAAVGAPDCVAVYGVECIGEFDEVLGVWAEVIECWVVLEDELSCGLRPQAQS
jgi:hypothetical protein